MPSPTSYWLITAPLDGSGPHELHSQVTHTILSSSSSTGLSPNDVSAPLSMPPLRVGTLASLINLSETLPKSDAAAQGTLNRIRDTLGSLLNDDDEAMAQHLLVKESSVDDYLLGGWAWNTSKYRVEQEMSSVVASLDREVGSIDSVMKTKLQNYNVTKGQLQQLQRKKTGNLSVRSLVDVVHKDDLVSKDSEFLTTLLVAVPKNIINDWQSRYERLTNMVVPRSSKKLAQDDEYALFNVTVFKKVRDEFVQKARENRFSVRDFDFSDDLAEKSRQELEDSVTSEKELWTELLRLSRTNFSECYQALVHLRVVRAYVESVLRYGLPADYYAVVVKVRCRCGAVTVPHARNDTDECFSGVFSFFFSYHSSQTQSEQKHSSAPSLPTLRPSKADPWNHSARRSSSKRAIRGVGQGQKFQESTPVSSMKRSCLLLRSRCRLERLWSSSIGQAFRRHPT